MMRFSSYHLFKLQVNGHQSKECPRKKNSRQRSKASNKAPITKTSEPVVKVSDGKGKEIDASHSESVDLYLEIDTSHRSPRLSSLESQVGL